MSSEFQPLNSGEKIVENTGETLWRQVNPQFIQNGVISSQAFRPSEKDRGELSVTQNSVIDAEQSYRHFVDVLGFDSAGSYAVTVADVEKAQLRTVDDNDSPLKPENAPTGHAFVDFRHLKSSKALKRASASLRDAAAGHPPGFTP